MADDLTPLHPLLVPYAWSMKMIAQHFGVRKGTADRWRDRKLTNGFPDAIGIGRPAGSPRDVPLFDQKEVKAWHANYEPQNGRPKVPTYPGKVARVRTDDGVPAYRYRNDRLEILWQTSVPKDDDEAVKYFF